MTIKEWYLQTYADDEQGQELLEDTTFEGLFEAMDAYEDVYVYLGEGIDSVIRERVFAELADVMQVPYSEIYAQWMMSGEMLEEDMLEEDMYEEGMYEEGMYEADMYEEVNQAELKYMQQYKGVTVKPYLAKASYENLIEFIGTGHGTYDLSLLNDDHVRQLKNKTFKAITRLKQTLGNDSKEEQGALKVFLKALEIKN